MKKNLQDKIAQSNNYEDKNYASSADWQNVFNDFNNAFESFIKNYGSNKKTLRR